MTTGLTRPEGARIAVRRRAAGLGCEAIRLLCPAVLYHR